MRAIHESFLREIWGRATTTYDLFQPIRESFLQKTFLFLRYRIAAYKYLLKQVYLPSEIGTQTEETLLSKNMKTRENICAVFNTLPTGWVPEAVIIGGCSSFSVHPYDKHQQLADMLKFCLTDSFYTIQIRSNRSPPEL